MNAPDLFAETASLRFQLFEAKCDLDRLLQFIKSAYVDDVFLDASPQWQERAKLLLDAFECEDGA